MCALSLKFDKASPEYVLKTSEVGKTFRFIFSNVKLLVPKLRVSAQVQLAIERRLTGSPAAYNYSNTIVREYIVPNGTSQWSRENVFCGDFLPGRRCAKCCKDVQKCKKMQKYAKSCKIGVFFIFRFVFDAHFYING